MYISYLAIYRLCNVKQLKQDIKSPCSPHLWNAGKSMSAPYEWYARVTNAIHRFVHSNWQPW